MISVYITTNDVNGMQYVGMHYYDDDPNDRYIGSGVLLDNAVREYGRSHFSKEIEGCFDNDQVDEADNFESLMIQRRNTMYPSGYNMRPSGGGAARLLKEESKQKLRDKYNRCEEVIKKRAIRTSEGMKEFYKEKGIKHKIKSFVCKTCGKHFDRLETDQLIKNNNINNEVFCSRKCSAFYRFSKFSIIFIGSKYVIAHNTIGLFCITDQIYNLYSGSKNRWKKITTVRSKVF
jgi:hypothetical protein